MRRVRNIFVSELPDFIRSAQAERLVDTSPPPILVVEHVNVVRWTDCWMLAGIEPHEVWGGFEEVVRAMANEAAYQLETRGTLPWLPDSCALADDATRFQALVHAERNRRVRWAQLGGCNPRWRKRV
jgi:hypothetical protein